METVTAYRVNGRVYESENIARRAEFDEMVNRALEGLSDRRSSESVADWLARNLRSGVHPKAPAALREALDYLDQHKDLLRSFAAGGKSDAG